MESNPTSFLDLPLELRRDIYSIIHGDLTEIEIKANQTTPFRNQRLISPSAIIAANSQINSEYYDFLFWCACHRDIRISAKY